MTAVLKKPPIYKILYFQVLMAVLIGVLLGNFYPSIGVEMKPFGDAFIKGIKMLIAPWLKGLLGAGFNFYLLGAVLLILATGVVASVVVKQRSQGEDR